MRALFLTSLLTGSVLLLAACGSSSSPYGSSSSSSPTPAAQVPTAAPAATQVAAVAPTAAAPAAQAQAATPAANPVERVNGTVQSVDGSKVILASGGSFTVTTQTAVTHRVSSTVSALQKGQTVAITAKRQPDNTLLASLVMVFAMPPNGFPLGQRPMDAGNLMTNATIDTVQGDSFTVTFPDGGAQVSLAPDGQVALLAIGSQSDIITGATITASVRDGVAQTVSVQ